MKLLMHVMYRLLISIKYWHTTTLILATLFSLALLSFSFIGKKSDASASASPPSCLLLIGLKSSSNTLVPPGIKGDGSKGSEITCWKEERNQRHWNMQTQILILPMQEVMEIGKCSSIREQWINMHHQNVTNWTIIAMGWLKGSDIQTQDCCLNSCLYKWFFAITKTKSCIRWYKLLNFSWQPLMIVGVIFCDRYKAILHV